MKLKTLFISLFLLTFSVCQNTFAQEEEATANPTVTFYSVEDRDDVSLTPGEDRTTQAPLEVIMEANIVNPKNYKCISEWRVWDSDGSEDEPLITRFEETTSLTLTKAGGYNFKLYATFIEGTDTIEYASDPIRIVISESKLTAPDGFSPNGDNINDEFRITAQSIVKLNAVFFNRWGQRVHSVTLENLEYAEDDPTKVALWDGKVNGKYVKDGVYFLNLQATGSDGIKYNIKKAVNVLKGFRENSETSGVN